MEKEQHGQVIKKISLQWEFTVSDFIHQDTYSLPVASTPSWPPAPKIKAGSCCKSDSLSCGDGDAKVTKVKIFTGHLPFFSEVVSYFENACCPGRSGIFLISGISFIQAKAFGKVTGHDF